jgi:hypothetical protein
MYISERILLKGMTEETQTETPQNIGRYLIAGLVSAFVIGGTLLTQTL